MFKIIKIWILSILVIVVARRLIGKDISRKRCKCVSINLVVDLPLIESIQEKVIFIVVVAVAVTVIVVVVQVITMLMRFYEIIKDGQLTSW